MPKTYKVDTYKDAAGIEHIRTIYRRWTRQEQIDNAARDGTLDEMIPKLKTKEKVSPGATDL